MSAPPPNQWPYNTSPPGVPGHVPNNYPYAPSPHYQASVPQDDTSRPRSHNEAQYQNAASHPGYYDGSVNQPYATTVPSHGSRHTGYATTQPNSSAPPPHPIVIPSHGQKGHPSRTNAYPEPPSATSRQYDQRQVSQHQHSASHAASTGWQADHGRHHNYTPAAPQNQPPSASHHYQQPPFTGYTPSGDWHSGPPPSGHQPTHGASHHSPGGDWTSQANYLSAQPAGLVGTRAFASPKSSSNSQWPTSPQDKFGQDTMPVQGSVPHSSVKPSRSSHSHPPPDQQWQADVPQPSWGLDTGTNYVSPVQAGTVYQGQPSYPSRGKSSSTTGHSHSAAPSMTRNSSHSSSGSAHAYAPNVSHPSSGIAATRPKCRRHGCSRTAYVDASTGEQNEWCGEAHQLEAVRTGHVPTCVTCAAMPQRRNSVYCSTLCETGVMAPVGYNSYRY